MGLEILLSTPAGDYLEVHESLVRAGGWSVKVSKLDRRLAAGRRVIRTRWLDATVDIDGLYAESLAWAKERRGYDSGTIVAHLIARSLPGRLLAHVGVRLAAGGDQQRVMCSEGACRLLWNHSGGKIDLRRSSDQPWADVVPQDALDVARACGLIGPLV